MSQAEFEPKIVAYVCNWCTYLGADLAGTNRLDYPSNVRIVRLPCTGRIDFNLIIKAFEIGADAVLVSGCHPGDCHYTSGNYHARRRWMLFRELLDTMGIAIDRIHFTWISAAEGKKWQQLVAEITAQTRQLGPYQVYQDICANRIPHGPGVSSTSFEIPAPPQHQRVERGENLPSAEAQLQAHFPSSS
jgi:F420-non-reducing hydrogenase iron-sulfur subunit